MKKAFSLVVALLLCIPMLANAGYEIKSGDANMIIGGELLTGYQYTKVTDTDATNTFKVYTAAVDFQGNITKELSYKIKMLLAGSELGTSPNFFQMTDSAYIGYSFMPEFNVSLGKVGYFWGLENYANGKSPLTWGAKFGNDYEEASNGKNTQFTSPGMTMAGAVAAGMVDYQFTVVNDDGNKYTTNTDNRYNILGVLNLNSKEAVDFEGYKVDGDFKYKLGVSVASLNQNSSNTVGVEKKAHTIFSPYLFLSYSNLIASIDTNLEFGSYYKGKDYRFNLAYLINKIVRPGVGLALWKNGYSNETDGLYANKLTSKIYAFNLTFFPMESKLKTSLELDIKKDPITSSTETTTTQVMMKMGFDI